MEDHHIPGFDCDTCSGCGCVDLGAIERCPVGDGIRSRELGHVKQDAACRNRGQGVRSKLGEARSGYKVSNAHAIIIMMINAHMAEPVELAANPDPDIDDIVISCGPVRAKWRARSIRKLQDGDIIFARAIGRCRAPGHHAERVGLAGGDQFGGFGRLFGREIVQGTESVICAIF